MIATVIVAVMVVPVMAVAVMAIAVMVVHGHKRLHSAALAMVIVSVVAIAVVVVPMVAVPVMVIPVVAVSVMIVGRREENRLHGFLDQRQALNWHGYGPCLG